MCTVQVSIHEYLQSCISTLWPKLPYMQYSVFALPPNWLATVHEVDDYLSVIYSLDPCRGPMRQRVIERAWEMCVPRSQLAKCVLHVFLSPPRIRENESTDSPPPRFRIIFLFRMTK